MSVILFRGGQPCFFGRRFSKCFGVAASLDDLIKDVVVLVYRPPQPVRLASNGDHDFAEVLGGVAARPVAPEAVSVVVSDL